jgi:transposase-like protein
VDTPFQEKMGFQVAKKKRQRRQFSPEYKAEVVALIRKSGRSIGEVARELDIADSVVRSWAKDAEQTTGKKTMTTNEDLQRELADARKRIRELEMERSILKKAAAFFAKENS